MTVERPASAGAPKGYTDVTNNDGPDHAATDTRASFLARTSKAVAGAITGAVTAAGSALTLALADGTITEGEWWTLAGAVVGGLVIGFAGVWRAPANKV